MSTETHASDDGAREICEQITQTAAAGGHLRIRGGESKAFYGRAVAGGETLDMRRYAGVVNYEPTELVITARAGTPLAEIEGVLAERGQMLAFEPPQFGDAATLGGTIACGISGPRRPYAGAVRDFVLGTKIVNGRGELLTFGGQVMKNVAGYDVSRLMVGAMGTLGVLMEVSIKVLPIPAREITLCLSMAAEPAIRQLNEWAGRPLPISASAHFGTVLMVRLSGSDNGVRSARDAIGGEEVASDQFWRDIKEHRLEFFEDHRPLWRLSLPPATPPLDAPGDWLIEWGGAQRWLKSEVAADTIRGLAADAGGHASLFRGGDRTGDVFHPLPATLSRLHKTLKAAFDPHNVFNRERMYIGL